MYPHRSRGEDDKATEVLALENGGAETPPIALTGAYIRLHVREKGQ